MSALIEDIEAEPPDPADITVTSIQPHAIREALRIAKRNGVTFVVIDVAGSKHNSAEEAAKFADLVLIPAKPITKELEHLPKSIVQLALAGQPPFFVLFSRVHPQATSSLEQPRRIARDYYNATPFPYHFTYRPAVWETADDLGLTPQELGTDLEAKAEIERAYRFISEFLNIERGDETWQGWTRWSNSWRGYNRRRKCRRTRNQIRSRQHRQIVRQAQTRAAERVHIGAWLPRDFKRRLKLVQAQTDEDVQTILARLLNAEFRAREIPEVKI